MRMILTFILLLVVCSACNRQPAKPTEFFQIKVQEFDYDNDGFLKRIEYFVVSNPPKDTLRLKKMLEAYNSRTIPLDTLKKYFSFTRKFYRETSCLTRNYKEGEPYPYEYACPYGDDPGQQIRYHSYLLHINFISPIHDSKYWWYNYQFGLDITRKFIEGPRVKIYNIDSLWSAHGKQWEFD
jgi:hypothetical protein